MNSISTNRIFAFFALFAICFIVFALRRPEIITNPQFWAEDGAVWYSQAYNMGPLKSLILPQNGYYQTISKLVASASLVLPLNIAPLFYNVIGISIRVFVIMFLLSSRMERYPIAGRVVLALFILLMPHLDEVHANVTNAHWYLSMWLFMVIIGTEAKGVYWKAHDYALLLISGLSGPFIVFIAPVLMLKIMSGNESWTARGILELIKKNINSFNVIFSIICAIQIVAILTSSEDGRSHAPLGASLNTLFSILSTRVFVGFMISQHSTIAMWDMHILNAAVSLIGIATLVYVFVKGDWRVKSMVIYPALMLGFALARPQIHMELPQWPRMQFGSGQRYFVTTDIFWMTILLILAWWIKGVLSKVVTSLLAVLVFVSGVAGFHLQKLPNQDWVNEVNKFNHAKPGDELKLKINPNRWTLYVIKK